MNRDDALLGILRIGHDASMRGAGLSLDDAVARSAFRDLRDGLAAAELEPLLRAHAELVDAWLDYSADKRTSAGWYVLPTAEVGQVDAHAPARFASTEAAVAAYVLLELGFWADVADSGPAGSDRGSIFQRLLGEAWPALPAAVRALHGAEPAMRFAGRATVTRGRGWLARFVAATVGFPAAGDDVPVEVEMRRDAAGESWRRTFAGRAFSSRLRAGTGRAQGCLVESFGPLRFRIALVADGDRLRFDVHGWSLWALPLPRAFVPGGDTYESARDGRFEFHIEIAHPWTGPIVAYAGWLEPVGGA